MDEMKGVLLPCKRRGRNCRPRDAGCSNNDAQTAAQKPSHSPKKSPRLPCHSIPSSDSYAQQQSALRLSTDVDAI
jgi:hypothetical protein